LSAAVGHSVNVTPVICLPGWMIERSGRIEVMAINGKNCAWLFKKSQGACLAEPLVKSLAYQLDRRCRDVAPTSYRPLVN
ncbi:MAG TPA: hypothetical protein VFS42_07130, partial [Burkholderiaceae bacterium]|nr:hypothetical protein [Burkholderiaceae bacterium]